MTHQERIAEMSRAVRAWCIARTPTRQEAEDLTQDVLLAMLESAPNLHDEGAFYAFMWGVARNVYRQWVSRRSRRNECELTDSACTQEFPADAPEDIALLRRELTLLSHQYREAAILYYVRGMKTAEIARVLSVSQSMVKYLLFKARIILKEGMEMERNYGTQSYHPRHLSLRYWGQGPNHYYNAADSLIRQNILFACYHEALTPEQIALEIGVGLPYMEGDIAALTEIGLLTAKGGKYRTDMVLFTADYAKEAAQQIAPEARAIAECIRRCLHDKADAVRKLGFTGSNMDSVSLAWQMSAILLHRAIVEGVGMRNSPALPPDKWGVPCLCWAVEDGAVSNEDFVFGASNMADDHGDVIHFMDFPINGDMVHHTFFPGRAYMNVFLSIAHGTADALSENDAAIAAELVRKGYVLRTEDGLRVNCPVFTQAQFDVLLTLLSPAIQEIEALALTILQKDRALLCEHVPVHLQTRAADMAYFRLFDSAISLPMSLLYADHVLAACPAASVLPTTYVLFG